MTSEAFLDDVIRRLGNLRDRIEAGLSGLTEEQLNRAIPGFHWTLAQVAEHVLLSHGAYIAILEEGLERPPKRDGAEVKFSWLGKRIAKAAGPEGWAPVPKPAQPNLTQRFPIEIVHELIDQTEAIAELARKSVGVDLAAVRVRNPFFGPLKLTLADCFAIPERHLEHHVRQLEKHAAFVRRS